MTRQALMSFLICLKIMTLKIFVQSARSLNKKEVNIVIFAEDAFQSTIIIVHG